MSQIEWAPAYLAAGITTVRDVGGEARFLTTFRDMIQEGRGIGPRLLLAGLVDGQDSLGFGAVTASTADEARAVVDRYAETGFVQVKVYGRVRPDVLRALKQRADEHGMTVTGHVPADMTAVEAMEAGMSGVTHLHYALAGAPPGDVSGTVEALRRNGIVVSPAVVWSELLGRPLETPIALFEPGIERISGALALNYRSAGSDRDPSAVQSSRAEILSTLRRLHEAGVTIVAGTDGGGTRLQPAQGARALRGGGTQPHGGDPLGHDRACSCAGDGRRRGHGRAKQARRSAGARRRPPRRHLGDPEGVVGGRRGHDVRYGGAQVILEHREQPSRTSAGPG